MFQITRDPSSRSSIQCLAKIAVMVLSCSLIWTITPTMSISTDKIGPLL